MKKLIICLLGCSISFLTIAAPQPLDKIAVVVNNSVITQSEIDQALLETKKQLASSHAPMPSAVTLLKQVINSLIDRNIQREMVKRAGIKISNQELNSAITNITKRNHMTLTRLQQAVVKSGVNYNQYRQQIREQIAFARLQQQAFPADINVSDQEVSEFLHNYGNSKQNREYKIADVLVPTQEQAQEIIQQIKQGKVQGDDLDWRKISQLPDIFAKKVVNMQQGQIAGPLKTANGYHVIKLEAIRSGQVNLNRTEVRNLLYQRKYNQHSQSWLVDLRKKAYIKYM